jgi:tetratricopeptide (TPR) repeat protein
MTSNQAFYPGNRELPAEVKDRVATTFRQAVDLFRQGRIDETQHGCDLILQMDPAFVPARKLLEKLRNPAAPVDIDSLTAGLPGGEDRLMAARQALAARDFGRAAELANEILRSDLTNTEAQNIGQQAQENIEAAPFVEQFLTRARTHLAAGNLAAARTDIDKARALDPDHPVIRQIENTLATMPVNAPASPASQRAAFDFQSPADNSFIVDSPSRGRSGAEAADFGFSFEEDHSPTTNAISFDNADSGSVTPEVSAGFAMGESQTFDFSTAPSDQASDDQRRIEQYLADGDQAFAAGDPQRATEIWSRIFLLDVTHTGASERIERARRLQLEIEEKVDALETEARALHDSGRTADARAKFEEILRLDPAHTGAAEYLERGPDGTLDFPPLDLDETPSEPADEDAEMAAMYGLPLDTDVEGVELPQQERRERPPRPAVTAAAPAARPAARRGGVLVVIGAVLLLFGAGYYAFTRLAGGSGTTVSADEAETLLRRAQALAEQGKYDQAINLLSSVPATSASRDAAVAMIAEIRNQKAAAGPQTVDGRPAGEVYDELLSDGHTAFAAQDFLRAKAAFERAAKIRPLPPEAVTEYQSAQQQVARLSSALTLFQEGNYNGAIEVLEGLASEDPENVNVRQLLGNAHFNLGANALREENLAAAISRFDSALKINSADETARRSRDIAVRYLDQPKDLLFRIYVKYLPLR